MTRVILPILTAGILTVLATNSWAAAPEDVEPAAQATRSPFQFAVQKESVPIYLTGGGVVRRNTYYRYVPNYSRSYYSYPYSYRYPSPIYPSPYGYRSSSSGGPVVRYNYPHPYAYGESYYYSYPTPGGYRTGYPLTPGYYLPPMYGY